MHRSEPNTVFLEELGLCQGDARVDYAVINGAMNGYEIKSDRDKLVRLPHRLTHTECASIHSPLRPVRDLPRLPEKSFRSGGVLSRRVNRTMA